MDEEQLQARLFGEVAAASTPTRPLPDMATVHRQLRRRHVTLQLLWEEYRQTYPDGYGYTQFCEHYKRWKAPLEVTLRQRHIAGEKTFLDWGGDTLSWIDAATGETQRAYLFVAVLGASNYTYAEAFADQKLACWIDGHIHAVEYFGGCTRLCVPDNAKTGVIKPCYYEPEIHHAYQELADHYGVAILPTRTHAPRDKAKVETAVLIAARRILAPLRDQTFFSLGELNSATRRPRSCVWARSEAPAHAAGPRMQSAGARSAIPRGSTRRPGPVRSPTSRACRIPTRRPSIRNWSSGPVTARPRLPRCRSSASWKNWGSSHPPRHSSVGCSTRYGP